MLQAFALGAIAQSSLLLSGILPFFLWIPDRIVGILAGFGAGGVLAMLTASLVPFAYEKGGAGAALGTVAGFCASMTQT